MERNELKLCLAADDARYEGKLPSVKDFILRNEGWFLYHYVKRMRYVEYYQDKRGIFRLAYLYHFLRYKRMGFKLNMCIYPGTVGPGFRIFHKGDFTIVEKYCRIGKNCTILPGTVFGAKSARGVEGLTIVGDNCFFGLGSKIFGPLTIGDNVTVGTLTLVNKDVPNNAVVAGVPAKIIKYNE